MSTEDLMRQTSSDAGLSEVSDKAQILYATLKADVLAGLLAPGERMSEALLSRRYKVSRSPVREATIRLEHEGLLERVGQVVRVRNRSFEEVVDIYRVRVFLESAIAADAATRRREVDLLRMEAAIEAESIVDRTDPVAMVTANRRFHEALAVAAHNVSLEDLQHRLTCQVATMQSTTLSHPGRWAEGHREHGQLLDLVRAQDVTGARAIAEQHMSRARDLWLAQIAHPK